jgi:hypothetical protein
MDPVYALQVDHDAAVASLSVQGFIERSVGLCRQTVAMYFR